MVEYGSLLKEDEALLLFRYRSLLYLPEPPDYAPHAAPLDNCAADVGLSRGRGGVETTRDP